MPDPVPDKLTEGGNMPTSSGGSDSHRVVLEFDDGLCVKLVCPESGCVPAANCGACGRAYGDTETEPCYDCGEAPPDECWVKTWFDNCSSEELLHGKVTVVVDAEWDGDSLVATIAESVDVA